MPAVTFIRVVDQPLAGDDRVDFKLESVQKGLNSPSPIKINVQLSIPTANNWQMTVANDMDLMREYADRGSETAFARLVDRYVNLVYSIALRSTGNSHDAQDVTQAVFVILAKKATSLCQRTNLTGWLYETTRFVSSQLLRTRARRQAREQEAYMQSTVNDSETDSLWRQLAPLLESAMSQLSEKERAVVALRFFENRDVTETAAALGIEEWAVRKRVERAMEKLRGYFYRHGIVSTTATLAGAISANSVQAAPGALAKTATAVALTQGAITSGSNLTLVKGALKIMAWTKAKTAIVSGAVLVLAVATTAFVAVKITRPQNALSKQGLLDSELKIDAEVVADRTTPRGTLLVMANALQNGDAKAYVETCVFVTPDELKLQGLLEEFVTASARFHAAIGDKFGKEQAQATQERMPLALPTKLIENADVKIVGASATVNPYKNVTKGAKVRPIQLIKVGNEWKLNGFGLLPVDAAVWNNIMPNIIAALNQTAAEIPQGKYETASEAIKTMKDRADY